MSIGEPPQLAFLFNIGRIERLGESGPEEFFYGARTMARHGFRVRLFGPHPPTQGMVDDRKHIYPLARPIARFNRRFLRGTRLIFLSRTLQCYMALAELRAADCIVAVTSPWIHAVNLLRRCGLLRVPIVGVAIGPFPPPVTAPARLTASVKRFLYAGAELVFLGEPDRKAFVASIAGRSARTHTLPFGVDESFWTPGTDAGSYVLSIGYAGRDYPTLLRAWAGRTEKLRIVTSIRKGFETAPPSVELLAGSWHHSKYTDADIRDFYRAARFVVIPLHDTSQPSGQSTALQAMACGKAIVITKTEGLWDSAVMQDGVNCLLVPPGDPAALSAAIDRLLSDPGEAARIGLNARQTVVDHYSTSKFVDDLAGIVRATIAAGRQ